MSAAHDDDVGKTARARRLGSGAERPTSNAVTVVRTGGAAAYDSIASDGADEEEEETVGTAVFGMNDDSGARGAEIEGLTPARPKDVFSAPDELGTCIMEQGKL